MKSDGQAWALDQLNEIAKASGETFEIVDVTEPAAVGKQVSVTLSVNLRNYERREGGIPFRPRERLVLHIPTDFPLDRPSLYFSHKRYGNFPHVQWGKSICLYQAPNTEWQPADGMFGFLTRVNEWLRAAAMGQLDPTGMPLHPPVAYPASNLKVVPRHDTPVPQPPFWAGYAEITRETEVFIELGGWIGNNDAVPEGRLAAAVLLPTGMPHEYPATMMDLLKILIEVGVPFDVLRLTLTLGALRTEPGQPVIFVLGAAMRGTAGGERLQHLACWRIEPDRADKLRNAALNATTENPIDIKEFYSWAGDAKIEWCRVLEDRPEIVERRDSQAAASWWTGRHVAVLGCGAIGSALAIMLARAGVRKLQLYDNSIVIPGILVRQQFDRHQIGSSKAHATAVNVRYANPKVEAVSVDQDIRYILRDKDKLKTLLEADVVIDATASATLAAAVENHFVTRPKKHPPLVTMTLGHNADFAMMTLALESSPGLSLDLDRRSKIALSKSLRGRAFLDEFWPVAADRRQLFQPEPGCSDPTFRGSAADVLGLTARMTNVAASWLADQKSQRHRSYAINLSNRRAATGLPQELEFNWPPDDFVVDQRHSYQIRLSRAARTAMLSWIRRSERMNGPRVETGGILFGYADDFLKVIWIDEVSGPPPDSHASPMAFVCGTAGVSEMHAEKLKRTRGLVRFMGMWHTHPRSGPVPSQTDRGAMEKLLEGDDFLGRRFLMVIVGGTAGNPIISGNVFERADYRS
jgi:hypothetical protein